MKIRVVGFFAVVTLILGMSGKTWAQNQTEGRKLYKSHCSSCHGDRGKGDGLAAKSLPIKPADHTNGEVMNRFTDKFLLEIISNGGGAVGKSGFMPAWGSSLNEKQMRDIIAYLRSIAKPPYKLEKAVAN